MLGVALVALQCANGVSPQGGWQLGMKKQGLRHHLKLLDVSFSKPILAVLVGHGICKVDASRGTEIFKGLGPELGCVIHSKRLNAHVKVVCSDLDDHRQKSWKRQISSAEQGHFSVFPGRIHQHKGILEVA